MPSFEALFTAGQKVPMLVQDGGSAGKRADGAGSGSFVQLPDPRFEWHAHAEGGHPEDARARGSEDSESDGHAAPSQQQSPSKAGPGAGPNKTRTFLLRGAQVFEVQRARCGNGAPHSWLIGDFVERSDALFVVSKFDPCLLVLAACEKEAGSRFVSRDQILGGPHGVAALGPCLAPGVLERLCETRVNDGEAFYRFDEPKALAYLAAKATRLAAHLAGENVANDLVNEGYAATFRRSTAKNSAADQTALAKASIAMLSEYLTPRWSEKVSKVCMGNLNLAPASTLPVAAGGQEGAGQTGAGEPALGRPTSPTPGPAASTGSSLPSPGVCVPLTPSAEAEKPKALGDLSFGFTHGRPVRAPAGSFDDAPVAGTKRPAADSQSTLNKRLQKAGTKGIAKLSSFFTKPTA